jgi:hypothetical protein
MFDNTSRCYLELGDALTRDRWVVTRAMMPQTARSVVQGSKGAQLPVAETEETCLLLKLYEYLLLLPDTKIQCEMDLKTKIKNKNKVVMVWERILNFSEVIF